MAQVDQLPAQAIQPCPRHAQDAAKCANCSRCNQSADVAGTVGAIVLRKCLEDSQIHQVTRLVRAGGPQVWACHNGMQAMHMLIAQSDWHALGVWPLNIIPVLLAPS